MKQGDKKKSSPPKNHSKERRNSQDKSLREILTQQKALQQRYRNIRTGAQQTRASPSRVPHLALNFLEGPASKTMQPRGVISDETRFRYLSPNRVDARQALSTVRESRDKEPSFIGSIRTISDIHCEKDASELIKVAERLASRVLLRKYWDRLYKFSDEEHDKELLGQIFNIDHLKMKFFINFRRAISQINIRKACVEGIARTLLLIMRSAEIKQKTYSMSKLKLTCSLKAMNSFQISSKPLSVLPPRPPSKVQTLSQCTLPSSLTSTLELACGNAKGDNLSNIADDDSILFVQLPPTGFILGPESHRPSPRPLINNIEVHIPPPNLEDDEETQEYKREENEKFKKANEKEQRHDSCTKGIKLATISKGNEVHAKTGSINLVKKNEAVIDEISSEMKIIIQLFRENVLWRKTFKSFKILMKIKRKIRQASKDSITKNE